MCESGVCERTCSSEEAEGCPIPRMMESLAIPVQETVDSAWESFAAAMDKEERMREAVNNGATGWSLMTNGY